VGGGAHYLATNSPYRNAGTTTIPSPLLAEIKAKTTYPPIVYSNATIGVNTDLGPQASRDTDAPDLGYHYDPLDYAFGGVFANANLSFAPGVAAAWFFPNGGGYTYGILLADTKAVSFNGLADNPDYWVNSGTVQEGGNGNWQSLNGRAGLTGSAWPYVTNSAQVNASFTRFTGFGNNFHYGDYSGWIVANINNSEFYSGCAGGWNLGHHFTNCLFQRTAVYFDTDHAPSSFSMRNCTVIGGVVSPTRFDDGTNAQVVIRECAFDGTTVSGSADGPGRTFYDYNAYRTNCVLGLPFGSHDKTNILSFDWQSGWLGNFYLPTNSFLIDASALWATNVGLYHFTTQTNQTKEGSSLLDIGYHYVATDSNGKPIDTDGDSIPNYLEDANGNGVVDSGETDWQNPSDLGLKVIITRPSRNSTIP
jgi:hypothetical protein